MYPVATALPRRRAKPVRTHSPLAARSRSGATRRAKSRAGESLALALGVATAFHRQAPDGAAEHHLWTMRKDGTEAHLVVQVIRHAEYELRLRVGSVFVWSQRIVADNTRQLEAACNRHRAQMEASGWQVIPPTAG